MMLASRITKDLVTLQDGESYGIARVLAVVGVFAYIGLSAASLCFKSGTFDPLQWGTGFAAIIAAGCFGSKAEEPK